MNNLSPSMRHALWVSVVALALGLTLGRNYGIAIGFWIVGMIVVVAAASNRSDGRKLRAAPSGSTRIETVKAVRVNGTINKYAQAGWAVAEQSTAKSVLKEAVVTITFRKP